MFPKRGNHTICCISQRLFQNSGFSRNLRKIFLMEYRYSEIEGPAVNRMRGRSTPCNVFHLVSEERAIETGKALEIDFL